MPVVTKRFYETRISEINSEKDLIALVKEIRTDVATFGNLRHFSFEDKTLAEVFKIVMSGEFRVSSDHGSSAEIIDFSSISGMINGQYTRFTNNGCTSCIRQATYQFQFDKSWYCSLHETDPQKIPDLENLAVSPRVKKYSAKGCEDFVRKFKPIEEVLREADSK